MEVKSCKHVSSFHHVIKIKLTRPASEQVVGAAVERLILGSRTIALSMITPKNTTSAALNSNRRWGGVLGAFARKKFAFPDLPPPPPPSLPPSHTPVLFSSSLPPRFLRLVLLNEPYIRSLAFFIASVHKCAETSVLVLEPEVRAYSVVSLKSSSLFCTLTSVCMFPFLFSPLPPPPSLPFSFLASPHPFLPLRNEKKKKRKKNEKKKNVGENDPNDSSRSRESRTELTRRSSVFLYKHAHQP